jgi:hypothetical protein
MERLGEFTPHLKSSPLGGERRRERATTMFTNMSATCSASPLRKEERGGEELIVI